VQLREDPALAGVLDWPQLFMGPASRQRPVRRVVAVKQPLRLPRPMVPADVEALLSSLTRLRDLAIFLLMLDGGLRPGEVPSLHLQDVAYGQRGVTLLEAKLAAAPVYKAAPMPAVLADSLLIGGYAWTWAGVSDREGLPASRCVQHGSAGSKYGHCTETGSLAPR
jgi:integrase